MSDVGGGDVTAVAEAIRVYLRAYTLPGNVVGYWSAADDHDSVAERTGELLAEHLAPLIAVREAAAEQRGRQAALREAAAFWQGRPVVSVDAEVLADWLRERADRQAHT